MPTFCDRRANKGRRIQVNNRWQSSFGGDTLRPDGRPAVDSCRPRTSRTNVATTETHLVPADISLALNHVTRRGAASCAAAGSRLLNSDYVRLAARRVLTPRRVMFRHALRTALIPDATVTALKLRCLFGGRSSRAGCSKCGGWHAIIMRSMTGTGSDHGWMLVVGLIRASWETSLPTCSTPCGTRIRYE